MKIVLKNIAKVKQADVYLNGITVIAGENNTGKSTVGKALFSIFNSFFNLSQQIDKERIFIIESIVENYVFSNQGFIPLDSDELAISTVKKFRGKVCRSELKEYIEDFISQRIIFETNVSEELDYDELTNRIKEILEVSDEEIIKKSVTKKLNVEFNDQINNVFYDESGYVGLTIKEKTIELDIFDNSVRNITNYYPLSTEAVYIDDPFVVDEVRVRTFNGMNENYGGHKLHLKKILFSNKNNPNIINEIIADKKLGNIYSKISALCNGEVITNRRGRLEYRINGSDKVLDIRNISTGLKTFVLLKTLLENGALNYNGTIILDEPEIHLHPQWQLILAELIVLIQKEFNMHILLNTHSPYFMKAIEVYSSNYKIADKCKYYLSKEYEDKSIIEDVTDSTDEIYKLLAQPLQDLENARYEND